MSGRRLPFRNVAVLSGMMCAAGAPALHAQERGSERVAWMAGVISESWRFATPLPHDSGLVERVSQTSFPVTVAIPLGSRWTGDLSGAYTIGSADVRDANGQSRALSLSGPTDVKLRIVGRLIGDALLVTAGVNAPTGLTKLAPDEVSAMRLIGSPVLGMPSPTLGSGFGATVGTVLARQMGTWAVAIGASYESRASYSPIDAAAAIGQTVSDLNPSDAMHLTVGADHLIGAHRLSLLGSYDVYGSDELTVLSSGSPGTTATFKLGPTAGFLALMEFGIPGMQELSLSFTERYRSAFEGIDGRTAEGSSGNSVATALRARWGLRGDASLLVGAEARFFSGLAVDASLATAAMSAFGGMVGVSLPVGAFSLAPSVGAMMGNIDSGVISTRATSLNFRVSIGHR